MTKKANILIKLVLGNIRRYIIYPVVVILYELFFILVYPNEPNCLVKRIIGIPCPMCGMSRAVFSFIQFDFRSAFFYHPLVYLLPFIIILFLFSGIKHIDQIRKSKQTWMIIISILIITYIIRMILFFPDTAPMDYYYNSIIDLRGK
jgi:cytochrome bd-type quinol oxidase subunit 2